MGNEDGRVADATGLSQAEPKVSALTGFDPSRSLRLLSRFMGEQEEREAVVDWLRCIGDRKPHGTDWRTYYEIADAIELGRHRDSDGSPKGEDADAASSETTARAESIASTPTPSPSHREEG